MTFLFLLWPFPRRVSLNAHSTSLVMDPPPPIKLTWPTTWFTNHFPSAHPAKLLWASQTTLKPVKKSLPDSASKPYSGTLSFSCAVLHWLGFLSQYYFLSENSNHSAGPSKGEKKKKGWAFSYLIIVWMWLAKGPEKVQDAKASPSMFSLTLAPPWDFRNCI
jgi:hypothetical protein